jgi:uncharacterized repeat protein (TIGR03803 family)
MSFSRWVCLAPRTNIKQRGTIFMPSARIARTLRAAAYRPWPAAGLSAMLFALAAASPANAQSFIVLHSFFGGTTDGANPEGPLIETTDHQLVGATFAGGAYTYGTVFKLARTGTATLLHSFGYYDGWEPTDGVIQGVDGNLFGTTEYGGYGEGTQHGYSGVVFELEKKKFSLVYQFPIDNGGSNRPNGVTADAQGNLYGVAYSGGNIGDGYIYKVDTSGKLSVLYAFTGENDGQGPQGPLAWGPDSYLYGATKLGGANNGGTLFKVDTSGNLTTLYAFPYNSSTQGYVPNPGLLAFDKNGNIYGTTAYGGAGTGADCSERGCGTVFKVTQAGHGKNLYSFQGGTDGGFPTAGVVLGPAGILYGTTHAEGDPNCACGVVFSIDGAGNETVVHTFTGSDGSGPSGQLLLSHGTLYGLTYSGGSANNGVAFAVSVK